MNDENIKKAAFVVSEYNEKVFFGGGEKVNYYIIKELLKRNYVIDVFANTSYVEKSNLVNIYIKDGNYKTKLKDYDLVLSTNMECESDITYSHNHSYTFEQELVKIPAFIKNLFSKSHRKKIKKDKEAKENTGLIKNIVVSSNILKNDYIKNYDIPSWKVHILPPGVEYKEKNIKLPDKKCIQFGIVAGKFGYKGGFVTLFAIKNLKNKCKNFNVKFIIKKKKNLLKLFIKLFGIDKYVEILPVQNDMTNFYNSIDYMLIPSIREPYGLVVTEAMSFSKVPILSSVCGAADVINDNQNGIIVDYSKKDKSKALAEKMEKAILLDNDEYSRLADNANNTVKNMSWDKFAQDYVNLAESKEQIEDTKVSVVIPVYNAEKYIKQCLNSIVNQTLKDIEIICVNDGSSDNSLERIKVFAKYDSRIKIINKQQSGSASEPRNFGLDISKGKYIYFIDSDDYIDKDYLASMYEIAEKNNVDAVFNDNVNLLIEQRILNKKPYIKEKMEEGIYDVTPPHSDIILQVKNGSLMWSKLFKRSVIIENNIRFPSGYIYEDEYFYYIFMIFCKNFAQVNKSMYWHRIHKSSLMHKGKNERKYEIFTVFKFIYDFYNEHNLLKEYMLPYSILKYRSSQISDYKKYRNKFISLINELNLDVEEIKKDKKLKLLLESQNKFLYRLNGIVQNGFYPPPR